MIHVTAAIALERSSCSGALYSAALMMRASHYKWRLQRALRDLVKEELIWINDGEEPNQEDQAHSRRVLHHTILRFETPEARPYPGSKSETKSNNVQSFAEEVVQHCNGKWSTKRVVHRCRRLATGRLCCSSRPDCPK